MATKTLEKNTTLNPSDHGTSSAAASSSYANVVNSLKAAGGHSMVEMKQRNDNNKENVLGDKNPEDQSKASDTPAKEARGMAAGEPEDDDSFIPVASLTKKERRKEKRQQLKAARPEPSAKATADRKLPKKVPDGKPPSANGNGSTTSSDSSTNGTIGQEKVKEEAPKKFVEAPIPTVNAWKVSFP